ncbi:MAG: biotin--[acetyl-CoA-carboxylase] ligase [Actinobacteria bacterium]|nr:biotin--[acetyl-CoA-carboxylase] ligase [Actinomycetota bacterium]
MRIFFSTGDNLGGVETNKATSPHNWPPTWHVSVVAATDSTSTDLLRRAAAGAADRSVLTAGYQTAGRGRLDRRWEAPVGVNLLASLLFRDVPAVPHVLTQRVALAALAACERVANVKATLKWPNDLLRNEMKLAGILAQAEHGAGGDRLVVVGIGVNVGWAPAGAARLGDGIDPLIVLREMLIAYDELPADPWLQYRDNVATIGRRVRVELAGGTIEGLASDVGRDGRLVVVGDDGVQHRYDVADVVHLR